MGLHAYVEAMGKTFAGNADYGQIIKVYGAEEMPNRSYRPADLKIKFEPTSSQKALTWEYRGSNSSYIYMTSASGFKKIRSLSEHELATIASFVVRDKRERLHSFVSNAKRRDKFLRELAHFRWFDPRFATPVAWVPDPSLGLWEGRLDGIDRVEQLLKSKGAGKTCWATSENSELDGKELELHAALEAVTGHGMGTILSFIPGKLAYYEGEDETLLLAK
jgi:hypothetical protein